MIKAPLVDIRIFNAFHHHLSAQTQQIHEGINIERESETLTLYDDSPSTPPYKNYCKSQLRSVRSGPTSVLFCTPEGSAFVSFGTLVGSASVDLQPSAEPSGLIRAQYQLQRAYFIRRAGDIVEGLEFGALTFVCEGID